MGALGNLTYKDVCCKLRRLGFEYYRDASGSHEVWWNPETRRKTTVAKHRGNLKEGTLKNTLAQAGIDEDVFLKA